MTYSANSLLRTPQIRIDGKWVGKGITPFIIAEISGNHCGKLKTALELILAAKEAGANAVKFQAYTADTITMKSDREEFQIKDGPWAGQTLHELYKKTETPFEWFPSLFETARKLKIIPIASVFDYTSVDMLRKLNCPAYKIASFEFTDIPLIRYAGQVGRPLILSTGMATMDEVNRVDDAINLAVPRAFLHCVSEYPTPIGEANLSRMTDLEKLCVPVGLSDHTLDSTTAIAATAMGAAIIEKHICNNDKCEDASFSLLPIEFREMVRCVRGAYSALQRPSGSEPQERNLLYRRSLYVVANVSEGEQVSMTNIRSIRPGQGLDPGLLDAVLGRTFCRSVQSGSPLRWEDLSN